MDSPTFDTLTRALNRRHGLGLLSLLGLSVAVSPSGAEAKKKKKACAPCRKRKKGKCKATLPDGTPCPEGTCQRGTCVPAPASPPISPPARLPDAACLSGLPGGFSNIPTNGRLAQTFLAPNSGRLIVAQIQIFQEAGSSPGDFLLQVNTADAAGAPTNNTIASVALPDANVGTALSLIPFTFPAPATLVAGTTYALVVSRPGSRFSYGFQPTPPCLPDLYQSDSLTGAFQVLRPPGLIVSAIYATVTVP